MKTDFVKYIEKTCKIEIEPKLLTLKNTNFVNSKFIYEATINESCFRYFRHNFRGYFLKRYLQEPETILFHLVIEEKATENSDLSLYEFSYEGIYHLRYTFDFDLFAMFFTRGNALIDDITINKNTILFNQAPSKDLFSQNYRLITRDSVTKALWKTLYEMPKLSSIAFEGREIFKKEDGSIYVRKLFQIREEQ